jgi:hypothetical protein
MVTADIAVLDKAREEPSFPGHNLLYTWTMIDGHLSRIHQYIGGFGVLTIAIDFIKLSCTVTGRIEAAPNSNGIWDYDVTNSFLIEVRERRIVAYTCNVRRGNIFATDQ